VVVKRPVASFVVALVSVIVSPVLFMIEMPAFLFAAMVIYEPTNPPVVKALTAAVVVVLGLLVVAVPVIAVIMGARARAASRLTPTPRAGLATAAMVIAGIVTAGAVISQIYVVLFAFGVCSLEGC
jgi:hypothetical protein